MEKVGFPSHSGYLLEIYLEMIWFGDEQPKKKSYLTYFLRRCPICIDSHSEFIAHSFIYCVLFFWSGKLSFVVL